MAKPPAKSPPSTDGQDPEVEELANELSRRIGSLVGKEQRAQIVAQVVSLVQEERFSGPIAHPRHLREYEEILPGTADRIVRMAESSLSHAQQLQTLALSGDIADMKQGRLYGFLALMALIMGALVCAIMGKEAIAVAFLGAGALGTVGTIIKGRSANVNGNGK